MNQVESPTAWPTDCVAVFAYDLHFTPVTQNQWCSCSYQRVTFLPRLSHNTQSTTEDN